MRKALMFAFFLLFAASLFALWTEKVEVHVVDKSLRPIKGAVVTVLYQRSSWPITDKDTSFDGIGIFITNESGKVSFSFANQVDFAAHQIYYYKVKANFSTMLQQSEKVLCTVVEGTCHDFQPYPVTFKFDAYRINMKVQDQNGEPIEGAKVYTALGNFTTDEKGEAWVNMPNGASYSIIVEYGGKKRTLTGKIASKDENPVVVLSRFDLKFRVINDKGDPVPADVLVDGSSQHTDDQGYVQFKNIISDNVEVFLRYADGSRYYNISLTSNIDSELVIDENPPVVTISGKRADEKLKAIFITAMVTDPNPKASGMRTTEPVVLKYNAGEGWKSLDMYKTGKDTYQATIPLIYDTNILFEITAYDAQDNEKTVSDSIFVKKEGGVVTNNTNTTQPPADGGQPQGGLDIVTLAAGVIVVLIVLLILYKKYTGEI